MSQDQTLHCNNIFYQLDVDVLALFRTTEIINYFNWRFFHLPKKTSFCKTQIHPGSSPFKRIKQHSDCFSCSCTTYCLWNLFKELFCSVLLFFKSDAKVLFSALVFQKRCKGRAFFNTIQIYLTIFLHFYCIFLLTDTVTDMLQNRFLPEHSCRKRFPIPYYIREGIYG